MEITVTKQEATAGEVVLEITIPFAEQKKHLQNAAKRLSDAKPIKGFRPGKATYEVVEKTYGGQTILAEAMEKLLGESLFQAVKKEDLKTVGQPKIDLVKQAYGNELIYKATISLMPEVKLGAIDKVKVEVKKAEVTDTEVTKALDDLRRMRATEKLVDRVAQEGDLVEIDFKTTVDSVPIEGGDAKAYKLVLGDKHMIPGFEEAVIGMKKDEEKTFTLNFPKEYKKDLAGKEAVFTVKLHSVYERELPVMDDDFAKGFGQENAEKMFETMKQNMIDERKQQAMREQEVDMLKKVVAVSTFGPIPAVLLDNESHRMQHELEDDLSQNGLTYDQYLENIGKTAEALKEEMKPQAEMRVKTALLLRNIALEQKLETTNEKLDAEVAKLKEQYKSNPEILQRVESRDYRDYLQTIMDNQNALDWLKEKLYPKEKAEVKKAEKTKKDA